jgi:two-component system, NarL family, nitrate/nitrite response regulator NarL
VFSRPLDTLLRGEARELEVADVLTPREIEMEQMVARGMRNRKCRCLAMSEDTVKIHLHHIYRKVKVDKRVESTLYAQ